MSSTIFLATGGTGGHVFPAVAVAERLSVASLNPIFITDRRGRGILARSGQRYPICTIKAASPYGTTRWRRLAGFGLLGLGFMQTIFWTLWYRPKAVIGFGGYPSVAPVLLGHFLGLPTMLHEQNAFFGRANGFLVRFAQVIALSWAKTANIPSLGADKTVLTGMPVRGAFHQTGAAGYTPPAPPDATSPINILITGGSLGAEVFGTTVPEALSRLPQGLKSRLTITHQARAEQIPQIRGVYDRAGITAHVTHFIHDMPQAMTAAHLVICRAGASSVAELAASGRPAILVPFPHAMDNHQQINAETVAAAGGGWCIPEVEMSAGSLAGRIASLIEEPARLTEAATAMLNLGHNSGIDSGDSAQNIAQQIVTMIGGAES